MDHVLYAEDGVEVVAISIWDAAGVAPPPRLSGRTRT